MNFFEQLVAFLKTLSTWSKNLCQIIGMIALRHFSIGASLPPATIHVNDALPPTSELIATLGKTGWATVSVDGGERETIQALEALSDQLGSVIHGRGGSEIETIAPTSRERAYRKSLSAVHGLEPLPLHVELSHRMRPCRYVAFGCLAPGTPSVATTILDHREMNLSAEEQALLRNAAVLVRSGRRSFYSSIIPADGCFLRFDTGCMEAIDARGRAAIAIVEDRLGRSLTDRRILRFLTEGCG